MIRTLVLCEIGLALTIFMVAAGEYVGLVVARRKGLTRNVSRLVTHGLLMALCLIYSLGTLAWWSSVRSRETLHGVAETPTVNWTYLLLGVMIAVLTSYELWQHVRAMIHGLTKSLPRLVTHLAMVFLMIVMLGLNVTRWELYLDELEASYRDSLTPEAVAPPSD